MASRATTNPKPGPFADAVSELGRRLESRDDRIEELQTALEEFETEVADLEADVSHVFLRFPCAATYLPSRE